MACPLVLLPPTLRAPRQQPRPSGLPSVARGTGGVPHSSQVTFMGIAMPRWFPPLTPCDGW
eukprot:5289972-Alexandrium_andersonii.AAC.1